MVTKDKQVKSTRPQTKRHFWLALSLAMFGFISISFPGSLQAQTCSGICVNLTGGSSSSGGSSTNYLTVISPAVLINDGEGCAASREVTLLLSATNASSMMISNDEDFTGAVWETYSPNYESGSVIRDANGDAIYSMEKSWTLEAGDGIKTVYVRYRSSSLNPGRVVSDSIVLDEENKCQLEEEEEEIEEEPTSTLTLIKGRRSSTVYLVTKEGYRRPFMGAPTYFTYAESFDGIEEVSDEVLMSYQVVQQMLPKPGTVLIKEPDDPRVYWTENNPDDEYHPILRWVINESVAEDNFGPFWQDYILDIHPTEIVLYERGDDIVADENFDLSGLLLREQLYGTGRVEGIGESSNIGGWQLDTSIFGQRGVIVNVLKSVGEVIQSIYSFIF